MGDFNFKLSENTTNYSITINKETLSGNTLNDLSKTVFKKFGALRIGSFLCADVYDIEDCFDVLLYGA